MNIKPLAGLTKTLCVLLKINIAIMAVAIFAGFYEYNTLANLLSGVEPDEIFLPSDVVTAGVGLIQFVIAIILGITFLLWIYRTNKNLHAFSGERMTFTPGWSVGWYFIPFANLYKPYQVMKEIWQVSHKNRAVTLSILGWWWALWLISNILGRLAVKLVMQADNIAGLMASTVTYMVSDGLDLVLNLVALMLVTRIGIAYSKNIVERETPRDGESDSFHLRR
jgi:hypothetical protein